jgi:UDPglucose 6-dehydrogenase
MRGAPLRHHDAPLRIIEAVVAVNDQRKRAMARRVVAAVGGDIGAKLLRSWDLLSNPTPMCAKCHPLP